MIYTLEKWHVHCSKQTFFVLVLVELFEVEVNDVLNNPGGPRRTEDEVGDEDVGLLLRGVQPPLHSLVAFPFLRTPSNIRHYMLSIRQECIAFIICNDVHMVILRRALYRKNYNTDKLKRKPGRGGPRPCCISFS